MKQSHPFVVAKLLAQRCGTLRRHGSHLYSDLSQPHCDNPVNRSVWTRALEGGLATGHPVAVDLWVPCRKCRKCKDVRQIQWKRRMKMEVAMHARTWFVTLTFNPAARARLFTPDVNPHQVALLCLSDYMKRLREHLDRELHGARLRFVAVTENHQDGTPHVHVLVHSSDALVARIFRKAKWGLGFIDVKLVDASVADYLVKYLTKESSRVRASVHYGREAPASRKKGLPTNQASEVAAFTGEALTSNPPPSTIEYLAGFVAAGIFRGDVDASDGQAILSSILSIVPPAVPAAESSREKGSETHVEPPGTSAANAASKRSTEPRKRIKCDQPHVAEDTAPPGSRPSGGGNPLRVAKTDTTAVGKQESDASAARSK